MHSDAERGALSASPCDGPASLASERLGDGRRAVFVCPCNRGRMQATPNLVRLADAPDLELGSKLLLG